MDSPIPGLKLPSHQSKAAHIDMAGIAESKHRCTWNPRLCARLSLIVEASFRNDAAEERWSSSSVVSSLSDPGFGFRARSVQVSLIALHGLGFSPSDPSRSQSALLKS